MYAGKAYMTWEAARMILETAGNAPKPKFENFLRKQKQQQRNIDRIKINDTSHIFRDMSPGSICFLETEYAGEISFEKGHSPEH